MTLDSVCDFILKYLGTANQAAVAVIVVIAGMWIGTFVYDCLRAVLRR